MEPLGELEIRVMEALWAGPAATVREVAERMQSDTERAYTTIMTTLDRLHRKGLLERKKDGLAWRYASKFDRTGYERQLADDLATSLLSHHGETGLLAFVDAASTDREVLDRLAALIAARRQES